jgi:hypothetical protein
MAKDSYKLRKLTFKSNIRIFSCLTLWFLRMAFLPSMLFLYTHSSTWHYYSMRNIDFQHFFLYTLSSPGYNFFMVYFYFFSRNFFVAIALKNKIKNKMKDHIAQRNKTTRKKWLSMLHVVGWHERIGWHQTFGKCIMGVALFLLAKFHQKWN